MELCLMGHDDRYLGAQSDDEKKENIKVFRRLFLKPIMEKYHYDIHNVLDTNFSVFEIKLRNQQG